MPNNAGFLPTFSGKTSLSLSDLDALSAAVKSFHGTEYVPVSGHRGQRRYKLANFNLDQVNEQGHDVYSNEGLVQSVGFSVADEPYISDGEIVLPMAHYFQPEGSETECNGGIQNAAGAVASIGVFSGLKRPDIVRGNIGLPLADYTECGGAVAGLISAVEVDSEATKPFISDGVLHLTAGGGDECCGGCTCVPAEYVPGSHSTLGLISSIDPTEDITAADIVNGAIRLPLADSTVCGGAVAGLIQSVEVDADATSPYISAGVLHLAAGGGDECCGGCACVPAEYVPGSHSKLGLISSIDPNESILRPDIVSGAVRLPYADTARGAVGLMQGVAVVEGYTDPLICYGNLYLPLADTCNGATGLINGVAVDATEPYISAGVLHLPLSCGGSCSCVPAQYNNEAAADVAGLIASVEADEDAEEMSIADGAIKLPLVDSTVCAGQVTGLVSGLFVSSSAAVLPEPGVDGWSIVLYLPMQSANGGSQIVSYRQLVRFYKGELQFSAQQCLHPNGNWKEYYSS